MLSLYFHAASAIILFILYRSCSKRRVDAFRLIFVYLLGTWMFGTVFQQTQLEHAGFNRLLGYGIMAHNIGECFLISRIWFGDRSTTAMLPLCYLLIIVFLTTFCPLTAFFYIGMLQGATIDFLLVISLVTVYRWTQSRTTPRSHAMPSHIRRKYMCSGMCAAVLHLLSIEPLFFGLATSVALGFASALFFLGPTFLMYSFWASSGPRKLNIVRPSNEDPFGGLTFDQTVEQYTRSWTSNKSTPLSPAADTEMVPERGLDIHVTVPSQETVTEKKEDVELRGRAVEYGNGKRKDVMADLLKHGLTRLDDEMKRKWKLSVIAAFLMATFNVTVIFFSPCYLDFAGYVECDD